jgi:tetratricopeptide (TPR) repeat protein
MISPRAISGRIGAVVFLCACFCLTDCRSPAAALDWKALHERAETLDIPAAKRAYGASASPEDRYVLALVYLAGHKNAEAGGIFDELLAGSPGAVEFRWGKAEVLRRGRQAAKSRKMLEEILKAEPYFAPAYNSLAYIKHASADFPGSVALAQKVIAMGRDKVDRADYAKAYLMAAGGKGMIAHYGGPLSKVLNGSAVFPLLKKAESLRPDCPEVLFGLGNFYFLAPVVAGGNKKKALDYFERAVRRDPLLADAYVRIAQTYRALGDKGKYEEYLSRALSIEPDNILASDERSGRCRFICISPDK